MEDEDDWLWTRVEVQLLEEEGKTKEVKNKTTRHNIGSHNKDKGGKNLIKIS